MHLKLQGTAKAVFNYLSILATTSKKDFERSPEWWEVRTDIIARDKAREPDMPQSYKLPRRLN